MLACMSMAPRSGPTLQRSGSNPRAVAQDNGEYARQLSEGQVPATVRCQATQLEEALRGLADSAAGGGAPPGLTVSFSEMHSAEAGAFFAFRRRFAAPGDGPEAPLGSTAAPPGGSPRKPSAQQVNAVAIMNFANGETPGGGYLHGARAQEEALCRQFPLYHPSMSMADTDGEGSCYPFGACRGRESAEYSDVLLTDGVECMRWDHTLEFETIGPQRSVGGLQVVGDPGAGPAGTGAAAVTVDVGCQFPHPSYTCTMVAAAAPCLPAGERYDQDGIRRAITNVIMGPLVHDRGGGPGAAGSALDGGLPKPRRCLVLGAWGCGAFRNSPARMAQDFAAALREVVQRYGGAAGFWDEIHFAVPTLRPQDAGNTAAFRSEMEKFCGDVLGRPLVVYSKHQAAKASPKRWPWDRRGGWLRARN